MVIKKVIFGHSYWFEIRIMKIMWKFPLKIWTLKNSIIDILSSEKSLKIDYVSVASLFDLSECKGGVKGEVLISVAVIIGSVRLIDNIFYTKA